MVRRIALLLIPLMLAVILPRPAQGDVMSATTQSAPTRYTLRPIGLGVTTSVRARSTRQIQIQVTDENDKPVPDLPVVFVMGGSSVGSLGSGGGTAITVTTNARGIATTTFNAGNTLGSNTVTARVEGTEYSWTGVFEVTKAAGFWTMRNTILVGAAVAAAGVATGMAVSSSGGKRPISPKDPVIKPSGR